MVMILGASSAGCEMAFSCMKRIKSYLRCSIRDLRIGSLAVLNVNSENVLYLVELRWSKDSGNQIKGELLHIKGELAHWHSTDVT